MKKISTVQVFGNELFKEQKLTIGVDLGDRWSFYCVLKENGHPRRTVGKSISRQTQGKTPNQFLAEGC